MKKLLIPAILLLGALTAMGQEKNEDVNGKFKEAKIREFVYRLEITDEQKPAFVDVYDRYDAEIKASVGKPERPNKRPETPEEAAEVVKKRIAHQQKLQEVRLKYIDEFAKVLDAKQLLHLYSTENEIQHKVMERKGGGQHGGRGNFGGRGENAGGHRGHGNFGGNNRK
ncbi:MAG: Spy/CpxP family protein refolding chaperone [Bacteroidales bacterium]|nr:Spy/CpxP family protein refolding chaperone [Bacteroidales bacterium]